MTMIMQASAALIVRDRVHAAAQLLDMHTPPWWEHVNQDRLDMSSVKDDVLAQVYEDEDEPAGNGYCWAVTKLRDKLGEQDFLGDDPVSDWLERFGFKHDPFLVSPEYTKDQQHQDLQRYWKQEVEDRRGQHQVQAAKALQGQREAEG